VSNLEEYGGFGPIVPIAGVDAPDAVSIRDPFAKPGQICGKAR